MRGRGVLLVLSIIATVMLLVGVAGFQWYLEQWDTLARLDGQVSQKWDSLDAALQDQFDLIGNLVDTARGSARHEKELFENIANVRASYSRQDAGVAQKMEAASQMKELLSRLLLLKESTPELKANESFLALQSQLEGTENRIKFERDNYNTAARELNSYVRSFFGSYFARKRDVWATPYFEVPEEVKTPPEAEL